MTDTETITLDEYQKLKARGSKYHNTKCEINGHIFDSLAEGARYGELMVLEGQGLITALTFQPRYLLLSKFTDSQGERHRAVYYVGDFGYIENGQVVCEDVKSKATQTAVFRVKWKFAKAIYRGTDFRIV